MSEEKKVVLTREYVINLRRTREVSRTKRAKYAVGLIRRFVARHLKVEPKAVKLGQALNEALWARSIEKPPRRVHVVVEKLDDGTVRVELKQ
ncbi:50S ribosomal protein L31e [Pyrobaculum calidifontis]|uniref:Large ribosomal subunit protein eL31 n=1 Tax=Pyrobaculum calidifontis (strain DSM 21063 / JCM 11548 / VA1) TaxID=410359 RepID=RL31_PYRCJ|nr:50S ribosomal protein L31e [Pyrobaculum calidifontis]A3MX75.1 RecName: Full=Large ribosomal subunit protein eL31; AltName: Full=50S ribosomal protein L31e [Pyrobaculum calidifontis JCM 11548]ABO09242.1 LSU ribosomal protein L31E [Pyrobaculum calidifontis JCM 11548]